MEFWPKMGSVASSQRRCGLQWLSDLELPSKLKTWVKWEPENDIVKEAIFTLKSLRPEWKDLGNKGGKLSCEKYRDICCSHFAGFQTGRLQGILSICNEGF